jgi:TrmH family RNA methyltransferase
MKHITSRHNSVVTHYRAVAHGDDRTLMLLDGSHLVADALAAGTALTQAAVTPAALDHPDVRELTARLDEARVEVVTVTAPVMAALSPVRSSSPIVALATRPVSQLHELLSPAEPVLVCICDVQDPGNVGAIVRVAEAGGATGVITAGASADAFGWKALRGSMGSALRLPIFPVHDLIGPLTEARRRGCRVVAAVPRGGRAPDRLPLDGPLALLVGGEGQGLAPELIDAADARATIPMVPPVESLNAAVCAALLVYEARRQRLARPTTHGLAVPGHS